MSPETVPAIEIKRSATHDTLVASLRSTHALEKQQIAVLESHLEMFEDCPDLHTRVKQHVVETREQARRLEAALEACGSSSSMFKDAMLSVMGLGQSSIQGLGSDAALKAITADIMQEHLEIATYRMLVILADEAGMPELRQRLHETLREEEAMATWFDENLEAITRRFVEIKALDRQAELPTPDSGESADGEAPETIWQTLENAKDANARAKRAAEADAMRRTKLPKKASHSDPLQADRTDNRS